MSELSSVKMHNTPETHGGVAISPLGTEPHIIYHVDWEEMEHPTPQMFHDLGDVQVGLANLSPHLRDEDVKAAHDEAMEAVNNLVSTMIDARDLDDEDAEMNLYMGNLDELPEVEKEVEQRPVDEPAKE